LIALPWLKVAWICARINTATVELIFSAPLYSFFSPRRCSSEFFPARDPLRYLFFRRKVKEGLESPYVVLFICLSDIILRLRPHPFELSPRSPPSGDGWPPLSIYLFVASYPLLSDDPLTFRAFFIFRLLLLPPFPPSPELRRYRMSIESFGTSIPQDYKVSLRF